MPVQLWNLGSTVYSATDPSGPGSNFSRSPSVLSGPQPKQWPSHSTSTPTGSGFAVPRAGQVLGAGLARIGVGEQRIDGARLTGPIQREDHFVRRGGVLPHLRLIRGVQLHGHRARVVRARPAVVLDHEVDPPHRSGCVD